MRRVEHPQVELQIAPMIDVCFLLLFFYILTSTPQKPEADLGMSLPGTVAQDERVDLPDEQRISILDNGQIVLNELALDEPNDPSLPKLSGTLKRFKAAADANRADALVTIDAANGVAHQRIVDVLNACTANEIHGVTFATESEEGAP